jgi:hypothetical protein
MLNITELIGFGAGGAGALKPTWLGVWATKTFNVVCGNDTHALAICATNGQNGWGYEYITALTIDGQAATRIIETNRTGTEYNVSTSIWVLNGNFSNKTVTVVATLAGEGAWYGAGNYGAWGINRPFSSYTPDDTAFHNAAGDPMTCNCDFYAGGLGLAVWDSYPGVASINYMTGDRLGSAHGLSAASIVPTADVGNQLISAQDGAGGNDGQTLSVVSFRPSKFIPV